MITFLPFDSNLFGYPVGKVALSGEWNEKEFSDEAADYQLVYIFSSNKIPITHTAIRHMDSKVVFEKELREPIEAEDIKPFSENNLMSQLEELAMQSGSYSRFNLDKRLENGEFEKLYRAWVANALEEDLILTDLNLRGMITLSLENPKAAIGLFAVNREHRGNGIGGKLLSAAESHAIHNGCQTLKVPTQASNEHACQFYLKKGYHVEKVIQVYHYWGSNG